MFWSVLTPLVTILVYIFVFSVVLRIRVLPVETGTDRFAVYLMTGIFPWLAFSEALNRSTGLLLERSSLITKVSFPVEILPFSGVMVPFVLNGIGFGLLLVYLATQGYAHSAWLWLPLIVLVHMLFTGGLVAIVSSISVFVRDLQQITGLVLFLWFYLTAIIYPVSLVPEAIRPWMVLNPMYVIVDLYRQVLLQHQFSPEMLASAAVLSAGLFVACGWFFVRLRPSFGDVL